MSRTDGYKPSLRLRHLLTLLTLRSRLRQLDQDIEVDYWRVGLKVMDARAKQTASSSASQAQPTMESGTMMPRGTSMENVAVRERKVKVSVVLRRNSVWILD